MNDERPVVVSRDGVGFCGLLTLILITLKLCKVISWPWIWVLAPLWISFGITVAFLIIVAIIAIIAGIIAMLKG